MVIYERPEPIDRSKTYTEEKFALFPKALSDGSGIWFETYCRDYEWKKIYPHGENYFLVYQYEKVIVKSYRKK
jgi:hypothetical protein